MTKKLCVIILSVVLCLAVVGGCFALYTVSNTVKISFGSEDAVTLKLTSKSGSSLDFTGVKLSPSNYIEQNVELAVSAPEGESLLGLMGRFTVTIGDSLKNSIKISATYTDTLTRAVTELTPSKTGALTADLPLDNLPQYVTVKLEMNNKDDKEAFRSVSNLTASVTVSWVPVDWAPVVGAYYILGEHCGWELNKDAIKMNAPTGEGNANLAEWTGTIAAGKQFKCVKYNGPNENPDLILTWYELGYDGETPKVDMDYGDGAGGVTVAGQNLVAPSPAEQIYVCVNEDNNSWAQTVASKNKPQA